MTSVAVKDLLDDSALARRLYATFLLSRSTLSRLAGPRARAIELQLRAWRTWGPEGFGPRRTAETLALIRQCFFPCGRLGPLSMNPLLADHVHSAAARRLRAEFASYGPEHHVRMRYPRDDDPQRQGDLVVLKKHDALTGEKGVLLITYTEALYRFAALFDLPALAARYTLVLEPSWWGYQDAVFLLFLGADLDALVQSPSWPDFDFLTRLGSNLAPIRLGAGDWVDPAVFRPSAGPDRTYDVVMVSSWSPVKRHAELFAALRSVERTLARPLRVALVGYPAEWTREDVERLAGRHGVLASCTFFESIPQPAVASVVADSRAYVLLSRREGANRALYEALFCDTPVVVYRRHRGVNLDHVTDRVGVLFERGRLAEALVAVLDDRRRFQPRQWALANTGYASSTRRLDTALRELARARRSPWTRSIVAKRNVPEARYVDPAVTAAFAGEYERLATFLLPSAA